MELTSSEYTNCSGLQDKENINVCNNLALECINDKIVKQCEFYFSDANILKDQFLLKLVKSSKEGWVDLTVVANFKKMQSLSKDISVIRKSLAASTKLQISDDGKTVRRIEPLPEWDKAVYFRSIILSDFPDSASVTVESIQEFFTKNGYPPSLVRVLYPNRKVPPDLKRSQILHNQLGVKTCAVVEFPNRSDASEAISLSRSHWEQIYVHLLCHGNKKLKANSKKKAINTTSSKASGDTTTDPNHKPLLRHLDYLNSNNIHVSHIREPVGPPTEESTGFSPGWRELLRLQRIFIRDGSEVNKSSIAELQTLDSAIVCIDSGPIRAS
uniref:HTH La-type RNA-binding domain-containing protein n=1 Tax=Schistosoma japonicum TaxID=6182 RepID=C1LNF2_SCHJA|nr:hypothetical protein [Schistosoma japonicum]CAX76229.1 hypothetical protein [Schistosoma japonicum]CAX76230.1 hypothetical protein [Schistosoma japonicum]